MARLNGNTVVRRGYEVVPLAAGDEIPEWAVDQVGDHLIAEDESQEPSDTGQEAGQEAVDPSGATPVGSWKVDDLRSYAKANGIDLHGATSKAEILAAVQG